MIFLLLLRNTGAAPTVQINASQQIEISDEDNGQTYDTNEGLEVYASD